ncbi:MAG: substrate-binding domain-containing protein, partial [Steroidobacteraceae bacterium]
NFIKGGWVDALLMVRTRVTDARVELARAADIPFVTYGRTETSGSHAWVDPDNEQAFYLATLRQLDFGHRRIALLNGPLEYCFARLREKGYARAFGAIAACRARGIGVGSKVSIIGYGNASASAFAEPPLSTIDHAAFENGRHVGQSLLLLLSGAAKPSDIHYLEPVVLVPRKSDGPCIS